MITLPRGFFPATATATGERERRNKARFGSLG
jgi:hypothetical protein